MNPKNATIDSPRITLRQLQSHIVLPSSPDSFFTDVFEQVTYKYGTELLTAEAYSDALCLGNHSDLIQSFEDVDGWSGKVFVGHSFIVEISSGAELSVEDEVLLNTMLNKIIEDHSRFFVYLFQL